jgi:hypothetical protein
LFLIEDAEPAREQGAVWQNFTTVFPSHNFLRKDGDNTMTDFSPRYVQEGMPQTAVETQQSTSISRHSNAVVFRPPQPESLIPIPKRSIFHLRAQRTHALGPALTLQ